jgi:aromatic ring-opening dioxygenase LigB subunit
METNMGIVFACIAPHGAEVIPELAGDQLEAFAETRRGMEELANFFKEQRPETVVLATPHGLRLEGTIGVVTSEFTEGTLEANNRIIKLRCECDRDLAKLILGNAKQSKIPVVGANYGASEGPASCMPMDWGVFIPLWFLLDKGSGACKVVIVTPSREISLQALINFGQIIAEVAENSGKRIAFVASADQGHAHKPDGPYGFHPSSQEFDKTVTNAVLSNNLKPLFDLSPQFVENAKPDSLWQIAILQGIIDRTKLKGRLLSYQVPTYFGLLCAAYSLVE